MTFKTSKITSYVLAGLCLLLLGMVIPSRVRTQEFSSPVRDVENPARTPFHLRCATGLGPTESSRGCNFAVPAGQRLVIENIRGDINVQPGQKVLVLMRGFSLPGGDPLDVVALPVVLQGTFFGVDRYALNQLTRIYLDHTTTTTGDGDVIVIRDAAGGSAGFAVSVNGYLVTL